MKFIDEKAPSNGAKHGGKGRPTSRTAQRTIAERKRIRRDLIMRRDVAWMAFNAGQRAKGRRELSLVEWQMRLTTPNEFKNC